MNTIKHYFGGVLIHWSASLLLISFIRNGFNLDEIRPVTLKFDARSKKLVCADVIRLIKARWTRSKVALPSSPRCATVQSGVCMC